jgi:hypothetical protein
VLVAQARDWHIAFGEIRRQQRRGGGAVLEAYQNGFLLDGYFRCGIDETAEDVARLGSLIAVVDGCAESAVQTPDHQRQLLVAVDLHGDGQRESIHVQSASISN